ncbi:jg2367 [Pararge aegeria aegeria]|uniref:Jg2367 protein n=1 Tax=Pararge aegeria aegeria TaxID=348720 RepID=A0A8S4S7X6_9NEOP|nr:jg2367 [Pararge aegeria aegeria]
MNVYDSRAKGPDAHWADASLAGRARWHGTPHSSLRIRDVVPTDRALYRCRVDFKVSPTRNYKFMLHVIESSIHKKDFLEESPPFFFDDSLDDSEIFEAFAGIWDDLLIL